MNLNLNQSELNTLKEEAMAVLEQLQTDYNSRLEDYNKVCTDLQLGIFYDYDSPGYMSSSLEDRKEWHKERLDSKEAEIHFFESLMALVFETDYLERIQRNILSSEIMLHLSDKYGLERKAVSNWREAPEITYDRVFGKYYAVSHEIEKFSTWEQREILAYFKSQCCSCLMSRLERALTMHEYLRSYNLSRLTADLVAINRLEEIITLGMVDVYIKIRKYDIPWGGQSDIYLQKLLNRELGYMLNHDFGKDVGVENE